MSEGGYGFTPRQSPSGPSDGQVRAEQQRIREWEQGLREVQDLYKKNLREYSNYAYDYANRYGGIISDILLEYGRARLYDSNGLNVVAAKPSFYNRSKFDTDVLGCQTHIDFQAVYGEWYDYALGFLNVLSYALKKNRPSKRSFFGSGENRPLCCSVVTCQPTNICPAIGQHLVKREYRGASPQPVPTVDPHSIDEVNKALQVLRLPSRGMSLDVRMYGPLGGSDNAMTYSQLVRALEANQPFAVSQIKWYPVAGDKYHTSTGHTDYTGSR